MVKHWKSSAELDLAQKNWDCTVTPFNIENFLPMSTYDAAE